MIINKMPENEKRYRSSGSWKFRGETDYDWKNSRE